MDVDRLREAELSDFVDALWLPAVRELAAYRPHTLRPDVRSDGLEYYRDRLEDAETVTYLVRRDDRLVGYATAERRTPPPIYEQEPWCHLDELFVVEPARRSGVASELLDHVESWARSRGCTHLRLNVDATNLAARDLYDATGFETVRHAMCKPLDGST